MWSSSASASAGGGGGGGNGGSGSGSGSAAQKQGWRFRVQEYCALGPDVVAAVLARLCDDLLDVPPIRGEIDRWVRGWGVVAQKGGGRL